MPEISEAAQTQEQSYRVALKQSSKGTWQGEYTVRANTKEELTERLHIARAAVEHELKMLVDQPDK